MHVLDSLETPANKRTTLGIEMYKKEGNRFGSFRDPGTYIHRVSKKEFSRLLAKFHTVMLPIFFDFFILFPMIQSTFCQILV